MSEYTTLDPHLVKELFANETGYATPKVDIRAVIFQNDQLLLVKEKQDGKWALPGGCADIGLSPTEVAVKEAKEESGFDVHAVKLLAVHDKKCHPHPPSPYHVYKLFIACDIIGGQAKTGTESQIRMMFRLRNSQAQVKCD